MNLVKILIRILLITSVVGGGVFVAKQKGIIQESELVKNFEEKGEELQGSVQGITDNIGKQTQEFSKRGQEVGEHVNNVLDDYVQPNENDSNSGDNSSSTNQSTTDSSSSQENDENKPIYEETLEYGQYLYCQQVIKDYEENN